MVYVALPSIPTGTLFTHNYLGIVRRSTDGGENWRDVLEDVECCGNIATRNAGEVYLASPSGLYFSGDNGDNWVLFDESKYLGVAVSPDQNFVVAATLSELKRFDLTGRLIDSHQTGADFEDLESCAATGRSAFRRRQGNSTLTTVATSPQLAGACPEARFVKGKGRAASHLIKRVICTRGCGTVIEIYRR